MKRCGFTLVEILIALLLSAVVGSVALSVMKQVIFTVERMSRRDVAWERGHNALSIIGHRALHAAFGITYESAGDVFRRSFGKNETNSPPPAQWADRGPLQIWDGYPTLFNLAPNAGGVFRGRGVAILYAVPSALRAQTEDDDPISLSEGASAVIKLVPDNELDAIATRLPTTSRNDLRSWVTFPLMQFPVYATFSGGKLTVRMAGGSGLSATLCPFDEMHCLRAERFYVQNDTMYSEELRNAWINVESRLEGVLEMWFEWTPSQKLLEAWVLTTGGASGFRTARPKDWPSEAPWRANFELHEVMVHNDSWTLKNM